MDEVGTPNISTTPLFFFVFCLFQILTPVYLCFLECISERGKGHSWGHTGAGGGAAASKGAFSVWKDFLCKNKRKYIFFCLISTLGLPQAVCEDVHRHDPQLQHSRAEPHNRVSEHRGAHHRFDFYQMFYKPSGIQFVVSVR